MANKMDEDIKRAYILAWFGMLPLIALTIISGLELLISLGVIK